MIRREAVLALFFSLLVNGGILGVGAYFYQAMSALSLTQTAGSDQVFSVFTLDIMASSSREETPLTRSLPEEITERVPKSHVERIDSNSKVTMPENLEMQDSLKMPADNPSSTPKVMSTNAGNPDWQVATLSEKMPEQMPEARLQKEMPEKASESATTKPRAETSTKPITKPITRPTAKTAEEAKPAPREKTADNSPSSRSSSARQGDQFVTQISQEVSARIEGCYPEASKRRGEEGVVRVSIVHAGNRLQARLTQSSGFSRLDRCAVMAVERAITGLKKDDVPASGFSLKPIRFQLR